MLSFLFFFPQIYQIPRCLTLKQRLQTLPTSRPEISQVGSCLCLLAREVRAGGWWWGRTAGGDGGPGPDLGLCSWCEEKEKRSSYLSWFFKEVCAVHVVIKCRLWDEQGYLGGGHRAHACPVWKPPGPIPGSRAVGCCGAGLWALPISMAGAARPFQRCCSVMVPAGSVGLVLPVGPWPQAAIPAFMSRLPATEPLKIPNKAWFN